MMILRRDQRQGHSPRHLITYVSAFYPPHVGGLESVAETLATRVATRHDVSVLTTRCGAQKAAGRETDADVRIRRFIGWTVAHTPLSPGLVLKLLLVSRRSIVHVHVAHAFVPEVVLLTSAIRHRPYVAHFHVDVEPTGPLGVLLDAYKRWILRPVLRRAAVVITLSKHQADFVERQYGIQPARIVIIPNGVDTNRFRNDEPAEGRETTQRPLRILFVGRLEPEKNLTRLLDALTDVSSDVELVIVGSGSLSEDLRDQADRLRLPAVRLVGEARGDALTHWYRWADAFVLPSDREGMPLVALEAMAAGLPIIATDAAETRELMEGVALLTGRTPESLAEAIERMATDHELRSQLSACGADRSREFDWDATVVKLERLYDAVAAR